MEDFLMSFINGSNTAKTVMAVLGSLVFVASVVVPLTPSKKDDKALQDAKDSGIGSFIFKIAERFSIFRKK